MSLVLDHVSYKYSTGTAYEIKALDDVKDKEGTDVFIASYD